MNTKTLTIFALLAALVMVPAALADYPMFGLDPGRTADAPGFAPVTDNLIWSTDASSGYGGYIGCGASVASGRVYVSNWPTMAGGAGLGLHCLNVSDGSIIWDNPLSGWGGVSTPSVADGRVFVGSYNGDLYCVNASDGATNWNLSVEPDPAYWGLASSPLIYDDMVYVVSFSDGTIHAVDFNGVEQWNHSASGASDTYMSVATDGINLFFGGGNAMNCVDIATQTTEWTFGGLGDKVTTTPAVCNGTVYFATGKDEKKLYAVDIATGTEVWNRSLYGSLSSPAISNGRIYIGDKEKKINCFNTTDGSEVWNQTLGGSCLSSPVVANGMVYATANYDQGTIYGFDAGDGTLKWSYDTGNWNMAQPSVSDGILFVGSDTGYLYAFSNIAWDCEVELTPSTVNVTASSGKEYTINSTCAMYALVKAAENGGFNYSISDAWYDDYDGALYFTMINDRHESGFDGWLYRVNYPDESQPPSPNLCELTDGDVVTWYWGSGMGALPEDSDMLIHARVCVNEPPTVVWAGSVNLTPTTVNVTADSSGDTYTIDSTCAMYALVKAAENGGFNYSINDDWYATYGSLYFDMIDDRHASGWDGWSYWVNYPDDPMPMVGANSFELDDGDVMTWYWSSGMDATPDTTDMLIRTSVSIATAIASDWTQFHCDIANTGNSPADAPDTNHMKWISENITAVEGSQAIIACDRVFVYAGAAGVDDTIYALNRTTGSVEWSTTFPGETNDWGSPTTPAYADGMVFVAAGYNVTRFDAATGEKLQETTFPDGGYLANGGVTVADGVVFVGSGDGVNYYALNMSDLDEVVWSYKPNLTRAYSTPAVADDRVVFGDAGWGFDDGYLYCVDELTGDLVWSTELTGLVWGSAAIDAANNRVYVATAVDWTDDRGKLYALTFDTGAVRWSADINYTSSTPAVSGEYIYVAARGASPGVTYCFDSSGVHQWNVPSGSRKVSPAVANGKLFTGDIGLSGMASAGTEGINAYDAATGALIWQYEHAGSSPSVAEDADGSGIVVSIGTDGMVYAFGGEGMMGDVNNDGSVTTADAVIALQIAVRGEWQEEADMNHDGTVTSLDALMILQAIG